MFVPFPPIGFKGKKRVGMGGEGKIVGGQFRHPLPPPPPSPSIFVPRFKKIPALPRALPIGPLLTQAPNPTRRHPKLTHSSLFFVCWELFIHFHPSPLCHPKIHKILAAEIERQIIKAIGTREGISGRQEINKLEMKMTNLPIFLNEKFSYLL
jgi:hypothetical protein